MYAGMKSVMAFNPKDTDEQTANKFLDFVRDNHTNAVIDRAVPNAKETRKWLQKQPG